MIHMHKKIMILASLSSLWFMTIVAMDESKKTIDLSWLPGNLQNNAAATAASVPVIPFVMPAPQHDMSPEEKFNHALLTIVTLTKRIDELEKHMTDCQTEVDHDSFLVDVHETLIGEGATTTAEHSTTMQRLAAQFAALEAQIIASQHATNQRLADLSTAMAEHGRNITTLTQQMQARQNEIAQINATVQQKFAALEVHVAQGAALTAQYSNSTAEQSKMISEQSQQLQAQQQEIAGLKAQSTALQGQVAACQQSIQTLNAFVAQRGPIIAANAKWISDRTPSFIDRT